MQFDRNGLIVGFGGFAWLVAAVIFRGFLNPFAWWLNFKEAVEFITYLSGGGSLGAFLAAFPSPETVAIAAGWVGIVAWVSLSIVFVRERAWVPFVLNFLFVPFLGVLSALVWKYRFDRAPEQSDHEADATPAE